MTENSSQILNFPASTFVGRHVPKTSFYEHAKVSAKLKQDFVSDVERITWIYKLSPETLNITAGSWPEVEVFEIDLKTANFNSEILKLIDSALPYPVLFMIKFHDLIKFAISYKELNKKSEVRVDTFFETEWNEISPAEIKIVGLTTDTIYANFIAKVAGEKFVGSTNAAKTSEASSANSAEVSSLAEAKENIELAKKRAEIQKQIDILTRKIAREPSIAKKQELAEARFKLREEIRGII